MVLWATKWQEKVDSVKTKCSELASVVFIPTHHTKKLKPWSNSPANCVAIYTWLSGYPFKMRNYPSTDVLQPGEFFVPINTYLNC